MGEFRPLVDLLARSDRSSETPRARRAHGRRRGRVAAYMASRASRAQSVSERWAMLRASAMVRSELREPSVPRKAKHSAAVEDEG